MLGAVFLFLFFQQVSFLGHDSLHNSVFEDRITNHLYGIIVGNVCQGISGAWWKYTHNMHHVHCNEWERDPDITHIPILAVSKWMFLSSKEKGGKQLNIFGKICIGIQYVSYLPIMLFARFNLYYQSIYLCFLRNKVASMPWQTLAMGSTINNLERAGLIVFWIWKIALLFCLPNWTERLLFFLLTNMLMGILHTQITLSHWERPTYGRNEKYELDFYSSQIVTSRNLYCTRANSWFYGGLQYQIEHHIFPRMPRHNLKKNRCLFRTYL